MYKIKDVLSTHGVIAFPTETVCGFGIFYDDIIAFDRLNKIKGDRENKPYTLMLSSKDDIGLYGYVNELAKKIIDSFMPGDITILIKAKENLPTWVTLNSPYVGIRVPSFSLTKTIIEEAGKPLLVPSLNRSNQPPFNDIKEAKKYFGEEIDLYIDGVAGGKKPSTIIKIDDKIEMIRNGDITIEMIEAVLKE